jgi:hypothetical protein
LKKRVLLLSAIAAAVIAAGCGSNGQGPETSKRTVIVTRTTTVIERAAPVVQAPENSSYSGCGGYVEALVNTTSCGFANNVFYEFFEAQPEPQFPVYSATTGKLYEVRCTGQSVVTCTGGEGAKVRFPMSAVRAYTEANATAYAGSHDLGPGAPVSADQSAQDPTPAAPGGGGSFCDAHACIDNFDNGTGYIVQCTDGEWSHSGGRPGACSSHGGETGDTYP